MMDRCSPPHAATVAERIAGWSAAIDLRAVPPEVVRAAQRCIIDVVGVMLAASVFALPRRVLGYARRGSGAGRGVVVGFPDRLSPVGAALVNGTAGHALDFDDTSYAGIMHGSTVVFPAALAACEEAGGDGRRLLEAFIAGSEVAYAVGMLCTTRHYHRGWWSTATFGAFGAAAAAARGLGLAAGPTAAALGLAGAQAGGLKAVFGTDGKPYLAGRAAAAGVEAALLAADGVVGPASIFEGSTGFLGMLNDGHADFDTISDLGRVWRLVDPGIFFKQYPVCSASHAAVELTAQLLQQHALSGDDVERVLCEVPPLVAISLVHDRPRCWQEAQFSMPFAVGTMLACGMLNTGSLSDETLADPRVRAAMAKVEMRRVDTLHADDAPEGARVTVVTKRGVAISGYLGQPTGMPSRPLTDVTLHEKFVLCAASAGVDGQRSQRLLRKLLELEDVARVSDAFGEP